MALEKKGILTEFHKLINNNAPPVMFDYTCEVISKAGVYKPIKVLSVEFDRDYQNNYLDLVVIIIEVTRSALEEFLFNSRRGLKVNLSRTLKGTEHQDIPGAMKTTRQYDAFMDKSISNKLVHNTAGETDSVMSDLSETFLVPMQLMEPIELDMRYARGGGIYRDIKLTELITFSLSHGLSESEQRDKLLDDEYRGIRGVEVYPTENEKVYDFIMIPPKLNLMDIPQYLQFNKTVYGTGLGQYFNNGWWFIYPLMDTSRFLNETKTLTIVGISEDEIPTMERTYMYRSEQLYVFSTGSKVVVDNSENSAHEEFSGFEYWRSSLLLDSFIPKVDDSGEPKVEDLKRQITIDERSGELYNIKRPTMNFTDNPGKATTRLAAIRGRYMAVNWDNSDDTLLIPGMPVRLLNVQEDGPSEIYGTLLRAKTTINAGTTSLLDREFKRQTVLTVYLEPDSDLIK